MNSLSRDAVLILQYFSFGHLPEGPLRDASARCAGLAHDMTEMLTDGPELRMGLRKLLEAKDCFVRQALTLQREESPQ